MSNEGTGSGSRSCPLCRCRFAKPRTSEAGLAALDTPKGGSRLPECSAPLTSRVFTPWAPVPALTQPIAPLVLATTVIGTRRGLLQIIRKIHSQTSDRDVSQVTDSSSTLCRFNAARNPARLRPHHDPRCPQTEGPAYACAGHRKGVPDNGCGGNRGRWPIARSRSCGCWCGTGKWNRCGVSARHRVSITYCLWKQGITCPSFSFCGDCL
jgi:hypothetical protein